MKRYKEKLLGFTFAEAMLVMVILGVIAILCIPNITPVNTTEKGFKSLSSKMALNIEDATTRILTNNATLDDFSSIAFEGDVFSITDSNATEKMSKLYKSYLLADYRSVNHSVDYFKKQLLDYDKTPLGSTIGELYSNFFFVNDGMLIGFRFYSSCEASELFANPPSSKGKYQVDNICGSIFFDVNSSDPPNKLGSDQYIIPVAKRTVKYENEIE